MGIQLSLNELLSLCGSCANSKLSNNIVYTVVRLLLPRGHAFAVGWMGTQESMAGVNEPEKGYEALL